MELWDVMQIRRSVRRYTDEKLEPAVINKILMAGLSAPSSRNIRPCEFIVVQEREALQKLTYVKNAGSAMLTNAACAIIVLGDSSKSDVWIEDCSIAMEHMHLMAASLGIGSCWVQCRLRECTAGQSPEDYTHKLLEFPDSCHLEAILSLGIPCDDPQRHTMDEYAKERVRIHWEKFNNGGE